MRDDEVIDLVDSDDDEDVCLQDTHFDDVAKYRLFTFARGHSVTSHHEIADLFVDAYIGARVKRVALYTKPGYRKFALAALETCEELPMYDELRIFSQGSTTVSKGMRVRKVDESDPCRFCETPVRGHSLLECKYVGWKDVTSRAPRLPPAPPTRRRADLTPPPIQSRPCPAANESPIPQPRHAAAPAVVRKAPFPTGRRFREAKFALFVNKREERESLRKIIQGHGGTIAYDVNNPPGRKPNPDNGFNGYIVVVDKDAFINFGVPYHFGQTNYRVTPEYIRSCRTQGKLLPLPKEKNPVTEIYTEFGSGPYCANIKYNTAQISAILSYEIYIICELFGRDLPFKAQAGAFLQRRCGSFGATEWTKHLNKWVNREHPYRNLGAGLPAPGSFYNHTLRYPAQLMCTWLFGRQPYYSRLEERSTSGRYWTKLHPEYSAEQYCEFYDLWLRREGLFAGPGFCAEYNLPDDTPEHARQSQASLRRRSPSIHLPTPPPSSSPVVPIPKRKSRSAPRSTRPAAKRARESNRYIDLSSDEEEDFVCPHASQNHVCCMSQPRPRR